MWWSRASKTHVHEHTSAHRFAHQVRQVSSSDPGMFCIGGMFFSSGCVLALKGLGWHFLVWFGGLFLVLGTLNLGIARGRPVAVRLDGQGASGYYVPTLTWDEVARVGVTKDGKAFAIEVSDIRAVRARQKTVWARLSMVKSIEGGWHILVSQQVVDMPVEDLADAANGFLRRG